MTEWRQWMSWEQLQAQWKRQGPRAVLAKGASGALAANVAGAALLYLLHVLLAQTMGKSHYGIFAYVIGWLGMLQFLGMFGLPQTIVRFTGAYRARNALGALRGLLRWADVMALSSSLCVAAAMAAAVWLVPRRVFDRISPDADELRVTFWIGVVVLPVMVMKMVRVQSLRAFGGGAMSVALERTARPGVMILLVLGAIAIAGMPLEAPLGIVLHLATFLVVGIAATWLMRRRWPDGLREATPTYETRPWLGMALPSIFIAGMSILLNSTDRVMIGSLLNTDLAGIYNASTRTAQLVVFGLSAVNAMLGPMVSGMHSTGQAKQLQRVLRMAALGLFAYTALGSLALIAFGPWVLRLFGEEFATGYAPLVIMVVAQTVNATCGSVGLLLQMTGHQRKVASVLAVAATLNVVLNFALIPLYGMNGAAFSTGISMIIWNVAMLLIVRRTLRLNPTIFRLPRWLKR